MKDLSLHLLDIMENSARAGATRVDLHLVREGSWLTVVIADNGPGFPEMVRGDPGDPYRTTRTERGVGLGLALFREAAEQSGGTLRIEEPPRGGVRLELRIDMGHIDARPLGDWAEALTAAMLSWPGLDLVLRVGEGEEPVLDTVRVKEEIGDIPAGHPRVLAHLRQMISEGLAPVTDGLDEQASLSVMKTKKGAADEESG